MLSSIEFYNTIKDHFFERLRKELPAEYKYHSVEHTQDVIQQAELIGNAESLNEHQMGVVLTAALFHDAGFIIQRKNHEQISCDIFLEYANEYHLSEEIKRDVMRCIHATEIPQSPSSKMEDVLCDADLDYLGRNDFEEIAELLFQELLSCKEVDSIAQWDKIQVKFLGNHKYHTAYSIKNRKNKLKENIDAIKARVLARQ